MTSLVGKRGDDQYLHCRHFVCLDHRSFVYKVRKTIFEVSDEIFWRYEIVCHHHEYAQMILAGGLIVILGLYTKYVSEIKLIESELHALF